MSRATYLAYRLVSRLEQALLRRFLMVRGMQSIAYYPLRESNRRILFRDQLLEIDQCEGRVFIWKPSCRDGQFYAHEVYRD